ncbi:type VII secretion protein EccB [Mycolicibacterium frederiksbergense]|uniref:type VII secretion protein EccB n=1 Tax=Mycolicibacterium frederiksbergense TaxID=117567 RepID=UPI00265B88AA|nr:type VII secretion protein EccB [Mycolicibacterium frederiksbergense]MDO0972643.1 type VII secretion protein EccB [Mycolicibacterium frederiksbergense]
MTRLQVSGYRFLSRRMEYALVYRDVRMLDDPIRSQSMALGAGMVLAAIVVAVCAVLALLRPHGSLGTDPIVMVRESGAMYVRVGDVMHPVPNLASARLIAGIPAVPRLVSAAMIAAAERGPLMGIPGAPGDLAPALADDRPAWTVCDDSDDSTTTMIIGPPAQDPIAPPVLVTAVQERARGTFVLHDGRRAAVDLRDRAAIRALHLDDLVPLRVSAALLDPLPEATPIAAPRVPGAGGPGPAGLADFRVGEVLRVPRAGDAADHYVVLADGVQRVGRVAADLIRFTDSHGTGEIPDVPADRITAVPVLDTVAVTDLADPVLAGAERGGVLCTRWQWRRSAPAADTAVLAPGTRPEPEHAIDLVQADGAGPGIDAVAVPAGHSIYARAAGVAGDGLSTGPRYLVTGSGVAFGVGDTEAAQALGLPPTPGAAPWPLLALLPRGAELTVAGATVVRDSVGASS